MQTQKIIMRSILAFTILLICYAMGKLLVPFAVSIILAYALHVPAKQIEKYLHVSSTISSIIIVFFITSICSLFGVYIIPLIKNAALILLSKLPSVLEKLPDILNSLSETIHVSNLNISDAFRQYLIQFGQSLPGHIVDFLNTGITLMYVIMYAVMTPILTFYLLKDWGKIELYFSALLKKFTSNNVIKIIKNINENLGLYIVGQLCVCCILTCVYVITLWIIGIDNFVVCGIFSGIMAFAPLFGALISFITTISISADNLQGITQFLTIGSIYLLIPFIDANFITPKLIGKKVGIQPFWLLFSICATVSVVGTFGIFISIPMAIILSTVCKNMIKNL